MKNNRSQQDFKGKNDQASPTAQPVSFRSSSLLFLMGEWDDERARTPSIVDTRTLVVEGFISGCMKAWDVYKFPYDSRSVDELKRLFKENPQINIEDIAHLLAGLEFIQAADCELVGRQFIRIPRKGIRAEVDSLSSFLQHLDKLIVEEYGRVYQLGGYTIRDSKNVPARFKTLIDWLTTEEVDTVVVEHDRNPISE